MNGDEKRKGLTAAGGGVSKVQTTHPKSPAGNGKIQTTEKKWK